MKAKQQFQYKITVGFCIIATLLMSCHKDEFTIENQDVTGDFTYTLTSFIPLSFDSTGMIPTSAQLTMEGPGMLTDMGELYVVSTFKFDFIAGTGSDFVTSYTGASSTDTFTETGSSQRQPDGSIILLDTITTGTGKFSKISGGGTTIVLLNQAGDAGTGQVTWKVTY